MYKLPLIILAGYLLCSCSDDSKERKIFSLNILDPQWGETDINMVSIPAGTFLMGGELFVERPKHAVTVDAFEISATEITQEQYRLVTGINPSHSLTDIKLPVEQVSWYGAVRFCNKLSKLTDRDPCYDQDTWECDFSKNGFRLPTEAEWEFACRLGGAHDYLDKHGWYVSNSLNITHVVGTKTVDKSGLYDMLGNVREWCNDWYNLYMCNHQTNPTGSITGKVRVVRGGAYVNSAGNCNPTVRNYLEPDVSREFLGFRIARKKS